MDALASTYIPIDRRLAIARGMDLLRQSQGAVLFADISGFTPLTVALLKELGLRRAPEELTRQLNMVYDALIIEVHRYGGSVMTFSGDAITCWFQDDNGLRATACGLAMQQTMAQFTAITTPAGTVVSLGMKVAVAAGPMRRFIVGDPNIQLIDVLAGSALERMAAAEHQAERGEVVVAPEIVAQLGTSLRVAEARPDPELGLEFALVTGLNQEVSPQPWPDLPLQLSEAQVRPWVLPPVFERLQSGQGAFLAEIRPAVALFMRFGGIDYDTDEQAGQKLNAYFTWAQRIIARYGGFLLQLTIGDKGCYLYAAFGAPITHENDPARAVAAAVELQETPPQLRFVGQVQIGISWGRMRAGAYGGLARHTYGVLGDEVNMAARLMQRAEPGQIIISQRGAEAVAQEYHLDHLGLIKVKGKEEPIPVSLVLGRRQQTVRRPVHVFPTPLVGREEELAQIDNLLAGSPSGAGQILRLEGPTGIGKSHFVAEFVERALRGYWRVVSGTCQSTSQDIPYYPWQQIFKSLFILVSHQPKAEDQAGWISQQIAQVETIIEQLNPAWLIRLPLLSDLLGLPILDNSTTAAFDPHLRQEALFTFAIDLIQSWAKTQPLLLLIEDAHWLDEASRELTLALARVITRTSTPVLLVVVHRSLQEETQVVLPDLDALPHYYTLQLGDLSPAGTAALMSNRLQGPSAPLLLDLIQLQAKGNPFFIEELIDTLREANHLNRRADGSWTLAEPIIAALRQANGLIRDENGALILNPATPLTAADLGLPDSVHSLVLARLDRLLEAHKLTLKVASVIGRVFEFQLLAGSYPLETDQEALLKQIEEIEAREFTRLEAPLPHLTHIFKHNITRDVTYETLLEAQRRQLHQAVAEVMESLLPEAVEQLSYHYSRAGIRDKTLFYLDLAARKAQREYANETALHYYNQALALEERWQWRKGQIEMFHILGRREEERAALEELGRLLEAPAFETAFLWGQYYEAIADYPQAQAAIERALAASQAEGQRLNQINCLIRFGTIAYKQGAYDQAKNWYQQIVAGDQGADHLSEPEARALIEALNGLGITHRQQGDFDQARACHERALTLSRQTGNRPGEARTLNDLGGLAFYQRHFAEAQIYHRQALEMRRTIGDRPGEGTSLYNLAMTTRDANDYGQAQSALSEALAIVQATGNRWDELNVWNELGILYQEMGDLVQAQSCLEQALRLSRAIGDEGGLIYILGNLSLVNRDLGDLEAAGARLSEGLRLAQEQSDHYIMALFISHLAITSLLQHNVTLAIEQAHQALALRREQELLLWTTADLATLAAAYQASGDGSQSLTYAGQAMAILDGCGGQGPELPQRDYFVCYQIFKANSQLEPARSALNSAYRLVMARAENIPDPLLRQSFLENVAINREIVAAYQD
jgi:predicted ATPase/class 3 adenylate cyclase